MVVHQVAMGPAMKSHLTAFGLARILASLVIVSGLVLLAVSIPLSGPEPTAAPNIPPSGGMFDSIPVAVITAIISFCTFVLSSVATAFTILFDWRKDRREGAEAKLKLEQLELELARVRAASTKPA